MELSHLQKTTVKRKKRLGRGYGTGKGGHTVGRGAKGQKARSRVPIQFEGVAHGAAFIKRLPLLRGKGKLKPREKEIVLVNVKRLNILPEKAVVTVETLIKHGIVPKGTKSVGAVKILGDGALKKTLTVRIPCSKGARAKILRAGGSLEEKQPKKEDKLKRKTQKKNA